VFTSQLVPEATSMDLTLQLITEQLKAKKDNTSASQETMKSDICTISAIRSSQEEFTE
jgi:hypothetical protein